MSEVKKIATRDSYGNALAELGTEHDNVVVLDADLAAATKTGVFKKAHPDRFIDCGIAESNMIGVAAGLATTGKVPFASSFAMFAAGRAFEQVRNSVGYPHLNVKIGATHAGISVGEDGATHQCNEDIALMRTIPGMVVINPADDVEARAAVRAAYEHQGPVYLRFGRLAVPVINDRPDYKFELGKGVVLREGKDLTIIATGLPVSNCLEAAEKLAASQDNGQRINNLCHELYLQDMLVYDKARQFTTDAVERWLAGIQEPEELTRFDLTRPEIVQELIWIMVLSDTEACEKALQEYRDAVQPILYELNQLLEKATPAWKAYAPRSSSLPESMSDGEYHEYTLAFPADDTVGHDFYFPRMVEKSRVEMFVKQPRMESIQDLLSDAGFQEQWIDMVMDKANELTR